MGCSKSNSKKKAHSDTGLPQETKTTKINNLTLHLKELEKEEPTKPKISRRKEIKRPEWGFPGGAVVGSLPANAGDEGSSPGLGGSRVPRSDWAREPKLLSLRVWSLCSTAGGAAMVRGPHTAMKSGPRLPQLEKALAQRRRPNTAINKLIN